MSDVEGMDVSAAQGWDPKVHKLIDWPTVIESKQIVFAVHKATEANGSIDRAFARNWPLMLALLATGELAAIGAYHFAEPDSVHGGTIADAVAEANHFCRTVCGVDAAGKLRPLPARVFLVLDLEQARQVGVGVPFRAWTLAFLRQVVANTGRNPLLYTGGPFFDEHDGNPTAEEMAEIAEFDLFLAAYVVDPSKYLPPEYRGIGWTLWQCSGDYDWTGKPGTGWIVEGVFAPAVDRIKFCGDVAAFVAWVDSLTPAAAHEPPPTLPEGAAHTIGVADRAEAEADTDPAPAIVSHDPDETVTDPAVPTAKRISGTMPAVRDPKESA